MSQTKLRGAARDGLQAALVQNQFGEQKPLKEIWQPMVERGRHRWLRGDELVGYEGILVRHKTIKSDLDQVLWALGRISHRWDAGRQDEFKRLVWKVPDLERPETIRQLVASAGHPTLGWSDWARTVLPVPTRQLGAAEMGGEWTRTMLPLPAERPSPDGSLSFGVRIAEREFYAVWPAGGRARTGVWRSDGQGDEQEEVSTFSGQPRQLILGNLLLMRLSDAAADDPDIKIAHKLLLTVVCAAA